MQHIIITGGSSGIGKATALKFAQQNAKLSILARDSAKLDAAKAELEAVTSQQVLALSADVSDRTAAETAIQTAIDRQGIPDLLVLSAGIAQPGYVTDLDTDTYERAMSVNYFGSLYCTRAVLPAMIQRRRGHLVFLSSGAGLVGLFGYSAYSPSKFAVRGLAESLRGELKPQGIGVSVVYPPDTDTPQLAEENRTKPPETQAITATAKLWTPDAIAREIVKGVRQNRFVIAPGLMMGMLARFHGAIDPLLEGYFDRVVAKFQKLS
ncbi:SDR family oxidoreductase [Baaleninema sp.]|uniref:SDR family oxidoreductase n=1 Tax=Baaleninema sp. TaxID=3101197 RepID=UPI003D01DA3B